MSRPNHPPPYPLFLDLAGRAVLVVGGGQVAERRVETLLDSRAEVTLVALTATSRLSHLAEKGRLRWLQRPFERADATGASLVFAATGDPAVDDAVSAAAREAGAFANVADAPSICDFHVPAIERRGRIQIAVGTGGAAPALAARLRDRFAASLGPEWEALAALLGEVRTLARRRISDPATRMRALANASRDASLLAAVARGESPSAEDVLSGSLADSPRIVDAGQSPPRAFVSIVGAGPGDPELITAAGRDRLRRADVVFFDDLVDRRLLEQVAAHAELIFSGKRGWRELSPRPTPSAIADKALEAGGKHVVRLKGGDPGVFGRLAEEIEALESHGVPFEIVPGVTAASAAAVAAGIPLTKRGTACSVTLVSGISAEETGGTTVAHVEELIRAGGTVAVYMGLKALPAICRSLVEHGVSADLPATAVSRASTPGQAVVACSLAELPGVVAAAGLLPPTLVIFGAVARDAVAPDRRATLVSSPGARSALAHRG